MAPSTMAPPPLASADAPVPKLAAPPLTSQAQPEAEVAPCRTVQVTFGDGPMGIDLKVRND
jgi:hypothetical protein